MDWSQRSRTFCYTQELTRLLDPLTGLLALRRLNSIVGIENVLAVLNVELTGLALLAFSGHA